DTGLDYRHPDLRQNVSDADSANCLSGAPVPGAVAADDDNGHGTHTAGTIAAAANGIGIVGVAPNVRVAGIKAGDADGFFFPEAVQTRDVTNACVVIPTEIPGVIGVTATGSFQQGTAAGDYPDHLKSYYSSYGVSSADVAAPGGDFYFRNVADPSAAINGLIL